MNLRRPVPFATHESCDRGGSCVLLTLSPGNAPFFGFIRSRFD